MSSHNNSTSTLDNPKFIHDCNDCKFLGHYNDHDLYYCPQLFIGNGKFPTVITRFGNDGPEYISGLVFADQIPEIGEAKKRAIEQGYLK